MKKVFFMCAFLLSAFVMFSQTTSKGSFSIKNNTNPSNEQFYTSVITKSNFEKYRLLNQPVQLKFKNGFVLELLSAKDYKAIDNTVDISAYDVTRSNELPMFKISEDGILVTLYKSTPTKHELKLNASK